MNEKSCEEIRELLIDFADGKPVLQVADHLDRCEDCRRTLAALQQSLSLVQGLWKKREARFAKVSPPVAYPTSRKRTRAIAAGILLLITASAIWHYLTPVPLGSHSTQSISASRSGPTERLSRHLVQIPVTAGEGEVASAIRDYFVSLGIQGNVYISKNLDNSVDYTIAGKVDVSLEKLRSDLAVMLANFSIATIELKKGKVGCVLIAS